MYIISVSNEFGSKMYYHSTSAFRVHVCGCKLSARRYKTFKGALRQLLILSEDYGIDRLDIVDITELCKYE